MSKSSPRVSRSALTGLAVAAIALTTACGSTGSPADSTSSGTGFPTKTVKMVVPYAAGGPTDISARTLAKGMEEEMGQTVIVENRPGASGITGLSEVSTAKKDGYTMVYSTGNSWEQSLLRTTPYSFDSFVPVAGVMTQPYLLVAGKDGKYQTFDSLKAAKVPVTSALAGIATTGHINMEILFDQIGLESSGVPFDGAGPAVQATIGSQTDVALLDASVAMPFVKSGDLTPLAVMNPSGDERLDYIPDVPTFEESGVDISDMGFTVWGVAVPEGTPDNVVTVLHDATIKAAKSDAFQKFAADNFMPLLEGDDEANWYANVQTNAAKSKAALDRFGIELQ